ncbi:MAG: hypothetical protein ABI716_00630 [Candidatus Saccharibacteria bacterium]
MRRRISRLQSFFAALIFTAGSLFSIMPAAYAGTNQCSWSGGGGDNNWSTAANWSCSVGAVPTTGYDLIFPHLGAGKTTNNDLPGTNIYNGLWFSGTLPTGYSNSVTAYTLTGSTIKIAGSGIQIDVATTDAGVGAGIVISAPVTTTAPATFTTGTAGNMDSLRLSGGLVVGGALTLSAPADSSAPITFGGAVSGSSNIIASGSISAGFGVGTSYTGNVSITNGSLSAFDFDLLTSASTVTVGAGASMFACIAGPSVVTIPVNFVLSGTPYSSQPKFVSQTCMGGVLDENYLSDYKAGVTANYTGSLTIDQNEVFSLNVDSTFSGAINGAGFTIGYDSNQSAQDVVGGGAITLAGSSNNTSTPNGTYQIPVRTTTLSDSVPANTIQIGYRNIVVINGARSDVSITKGGTLKGTGTVGAVNVAGGTIAPGNSPGVLNSGTIVLDSASTLDEEIGGIAGGSYDQLNVTGTVDLGGATLNTSLYGGFVPSLNDSFTIINNDGADAVTGTFNGLPEGAEFNVGAVKFKISYVGGDGNDVTLKATYVPGPPGTGSALLRPNVILPAIVTLIGAALFISQRKLYKTNLVKRSHR